MEDRFQDKIKRDFSHSRIYIKMLLKWSFLSIISGIICGFIGAAFHYAVNYATEIRLAHNWLIFFLPIAGLLIVFIYRQCGVKKDEGTNLVISSIREKHDLPANMIVLIFIGTVLTHLCGGSTGREGAALQIGGSTGFLLGRIFHLDENEKRIITMSGMSALFTALFGTPLAATVFSMEVITIGMMEYAAFLPCILASMIALAITNFLGIEEFAYTITSIPELSLSNGLKIVVIAVSACLISAIFVKGMQYTTTFFVQKFPNQYIRVLVGGVIVVLLTLLSGSNNYNGAGMDMINASFAGKIVWYACIVKILFTIITMSSGFKGGEIIPSFFIGATLGNVLGSCMGMDISFAAAIGMICVFCCVVNCPTASVMMSIELFGSTNVLYFAFACAICFLLSGYFSLYSAQGFAQSKRPLPVDDDAKS
jgi:H+/Cl- antiporter ClcA